MTRAQALVLARAARAKKHPLPIRFWSKVQKGKRDECWPWKASVRRNDEGYGAFWLDGRHQPASKTAWMLSNKKSVPTGLCVCHHCDNPKCCNPKHLFLASPLDNNNDKIKKKRHAFGERNGYSKLTEKQVIKIKKLKPGNRSPSGFRTKIAQQFKVKPGTITGIWGSRSWTHLD